MNIEKQTFNTLDVLYDDKKWGKRIDPDEWNANFKVLEEGHNELAQKLNRQVADIDVAVQAATSDGGQNINVQYGEGTETLQNALDNVVSNINNRYTKNEVDATVGSNTNSLLANAEYNESTGVFIFTRKDGSKVVIDTVIEKVPVSMALKDEPDGSVSLVITNQDGSTTKTNVTSLIEDTVINSSDTINATSVTDAVKKVTTYTLVIKPNSIGLSHVNTELTAKFEETQTAKTLAIQAKDNAVAAKTAAETARNNAQNFANEAHAYKTSASVSAEESANSALEARGYAEQASSSKESAALSASTASSKATAAATSEANAKTSETNAKTSETNAFNSAKDAKTYAEQAKTHATNAGNSANQASTYATNASDSADSASLKANEASDSAASALTYKNAAELANTQAQAAKAAAEKARDEAESIVGGDYASVSYVDGKVAGLASETYVNNKTTDMATQTFVNQKVDGLASETYVNDKTNDMATQSFVNQKVNGLASETYVNNKVSGLASETYVNNKVAGLATEEYVQQNGGKINSISVDGTTQTIDSNKNVNIVLSGKVDKVSGKQLSTEDYTTAEKNKVANLPSNTNTALSNKVDKVSGKGLSTNDYTNTEKTKLSSLNAAIIVQSNVSVATSAWASDTTYTDYPYRASIPITGCTANHIPEVVFSLADALSGTFSPVAETYTGGVYIYASESADITIPTIKLTKVVE